MYRDILGASEIVHRAVEALCGVLLNQKLVSKTIAKVGLVNLMKISIQGIPLRHSDRLEVLYPSCMEDRNYWSNQALVALHSDTNESSGKLKGWC